MKHTHTHTQKYTDIRTLTLKHTRQEGVSKSESESKILTCNQIREKVSRMRYRVSELVCRRHVQSVRRTGFDHLFNGKGKGNPMRDGGIKQKNVTVQKEKYKSLKKESTEKRKK